MSVVDASTLGDGTALFHWSPRDRRDAIHEHGLRIRQPSPQGAEHRLPFVALALSPTHAWQMSGEPFGPELRYWDLWQVWYGDLRGLVEVVPFDDMTPREIRVYRSIPAGRVEYVGTRDRRSPRW